MEKCAFNKGTKKKNADLRLKMGRRVGVSERKREKFLFGFFAMPWPFFSLFSVTVMAFSQPLELSSKFFLVQVCTIDPDRC